MEGGLLVHFLQCRRFHFIIIMADDVLLDLNLSAEDIKVAVKAHVCWQNSGKPVPGLFG